MMQPASPPMSCTRGAQMVSSMLLPDASLSVSLRLEASPPLLVDAVSTSPTSRMMATTRTYVSTGSDGTLPMATSGRMVTLGAA